MCTLPPVGSRVELIQSDTEEVVAVGTIDSIKGLKNKKIYFHDDAAFKPEPFALVDGCWRFLHRDLSDQLTYSQRAPGYKFRKVATMEAF